MDNQLRNRVILASLLHDIGKFYQRADKSFSDKFNELSEYSRRIAEDICPINEHGRFGYLHVVWTNEFIESRKTVFDKIPGMKSDIYMNDKLMDSMASLACNHHKPHSLIQALVTMADWWSAGIDRSQSSTLEMESLDKETLIKWGGDRYKRIPLYSVFNEINLINKEAYSSAFSLHPLNIETETFFPKEIKAVSDGVSQEQYQFLWKNFCKEFGELPVDSFEGFTESLVYLLKKYTWCIPSNTMDMANVSLYEHLKTTAAFAYCFFTYYSENPALFSWNGTKISIKDGCKPVILLGGDVSGIQKFIYNISSKKAAVSLKGRSFYLQLLVDSVIQRIISHPDIEATIAQVVYSSGGKFYMLLPNTTKVISAIDALRQEFEQKLWEEHKGALLLNIDYVPFMFNTDSKSFSFDGAKPNANIGDLWKALADKLTSCKNSPFKTMATKYELFTAKEVSADDKVCAVTGVEGKCVKLSSEGNETIWVLPSVKKQCELGTVLKDADYIVTYTKDIDPKYLNNRSKLEVNILGVHNYLFDEKELALNASEFVGITSVDVCRVKSINRLVIPSLKGVSCRYAFQFYGGNKQALVYGNNKTFEELADDEYLGVLRMDVDNLGAIFIKGLPESSKSFAAYSTLSFMLDWFFSGYLNTIREQNIFRDDVNILYSGGDDVFAVGKWDKLILFAAEVRRSFAKFVGRDDISISAGIVFVNAKFPISKSALLSGDAESNAKNFAQYGLPNKNAINLFGVNVSWKNEFDMVESLKSEFVNLIAYDEMPRSILHRLMILWQKKNEGDMSYMWHTAYYLKRFSEKKSEKISEFCKRLKTDLCNSRKYDLTAVACRWAELELRFSDKDNNIKNN